MTDQTKVEFEKATIYTTSEFMGNVTKTEVRKGSVEIKPYAQYTDAVHVRCVKKGCRKAVGCVKYYNAYVLILEGHGHPEPASLYGEAKKSDCGEYSTSQSRHRSFADGWLDDWRPVIETYLQEKGIVPVFGVDQKLPKSV